jgi:hypothetical protein
MDGSHTEGTEDTEDTEEGWEGIGRGARAGAACRAECVADPSVAAVHGVREGEGGAAPSG